MVPADSDHVSRVWSYSGTLIERLHHFAYGTVALCGARFHVLRLSLNFVTAARSRTTWTERPTTPGRQRVRACTDQVWARIPFRSPLLGEYRLISFPPGTEMFQFPDLSRSYLCIQYAVPPYYQRWVSPFGYPRITGYSAPHRGFSQPFTPFIDSWCQGIHHVPLTS